MTRVKICGLTIYADALAAANLGADALGFVFAPRSRRRADPETVAAFASGLPPFVTLVGVFQDQPLSEVREIMKGCGLHVAQLHGLESPSYLLELGLPSFKAFSVKREEDIAGIALYPGAGGYLLDSGAGGSGLPFDWTLAAAARKFGRIVVAGGLTPGNVGEAIKTARPWGVDTAGGVEVSPGVKDHRRIAEFMKAVRDADRALEEAG